MAGIPLTFAYPGFDGGSGGEASKKARKQASNSQSRLGQEPATGSPPQYTETAPRSPSSAPFSFLGEVVY